MADKYSLIPETDHVGRVCGRQAQLREDGSIVGIKSRLFELRQKINETYLSCQWLEMYRGDFVQNINSVIAELKRKPGFERLGKTKDVLAVLSVRSILECGNTRNTEISVKYKGNKTNPSYAGIFGLPANNSDEQLLEALAAEALVDIAKF